MNITEPIVFTKAENESALAALHNAFVEGANVMGYMIDSMSITPEEKQEKFTESAVDEAIATAILESYEDGPIFEAVTRKDKERVKSIVRTLRPKIEEVLVKNKVSFYKPNFIARIIVGGLGLAAGIATGAAAGKALAGAGVAAAKGAIASKAIPIAGTAIGKHIAAGAGVTAAKAAAGAAAGAAVANSGGKSVGAGLKQVLQTRLWQVIGVVHMEEGNISSLCDRLTQQFSDELGEYKIIPLKSNPTLHDAFKTHFGWKDARKSFFLLVDRKLDSELAKLNDELVDDAAEYSDVANK